MNDELIIGMLSGSGRDGVDAVLVNFIQDTMNILHTSCTSYPPAIKLTLDQLLATGEPPRPEVASLLDENLGRFLARIAQDLVRETGMEMRDIRAIGSHGQTVWHEPDGDMPLTIQLGKPELIARGTSTTVVANFRSADLSCGGQGAPLAPLLHKHLFHSNTENRAVLNLGGIASLTLLPAAGGLAVFDCGPGNCLVNGWTSHHLKKTYDNNGNWARKGLVDTGLLERMLLDPYFQLPTPKSTVLEYFNMSWLDKALGNSDLQPVNVQATLVELTALSVASSLQEFETTARLLVCGGGANNTFMIRRIAAALPGVVVESTAHRGADPDWVDGLLFAWLARERLNERLQDTGPLTGADRPVLLGDVFEPPAQRQRF